MHETQTLVHQECGAFLLAELKKAGLLQTSYRTIQLTDIKGLMQTLSSESDCQYAELLPLLAEDRSSP